MGPVVTNVLGELIRNALCLCLSLNLGQGSLLNVSPDTTNFRIAIWFWWNCKLGFVPSKDSSVDPRNILVPDLAPHVRTSTSASIQAMSSCELTNIEMEPVGVTQCRDRDKLIWRLLRKK